MEASAIRYRITGDNSELNRALDNVQNSANAAAQAVTNISNSINNISENASQAQTAISGIAASASNAADSAETAAAATQQAAQAAAISQEAYEAALAAQQRLSSQIQNTENRLAALRASEADMSAAEQSGDISAAAYRRYQREIQQTTDRLNSLNIQHSAVSAQVAQMSGSISAAATASNTAATALQGVSTSAQTAAENVDNVRENTRQTGNEAEATAKKSNSAFAKIGEAAGKAALAIAKISLAATGAAAAGIGILSKKAIECYSDYEQLTGGVETLFKDSADVVMQYADNAYRAAGMSANAYMETVTSFSASLLQGLDGDTAKAAEIANKAIVDMSDNANKMGTSMDMIQNAYQGFAKQNYTMLDNLKLGYGGTQSEMARLINDSGVLGDSMTVTAETVNSVSFDKIIEAIHVIQTNMGITGTTAKEASTTIQGSISAMSAAWENFMTGVADPSQDFDKLTSNLIDSVLTVADNLMPRIMAVLPQLATGLEELAGNLLPLIPETLEKMLPDVLTGANNLISALLETLSSIAEVAIPIVSENAEEIIDTLLTGMLESLPAIATSAVDLCSALIEAVLGNADIITQGAVDLIIALAEGIGNNLDELIPAAVEAVLTIVETLIYNTDKLLDAAEKLIIGLADGLINSLPKLLEKAPEIVVELISALTAAIPDVIEFAVELCGNIAETLLTYDWSNVGANMYDNLHTALNNALHGDKDYTEKMAQKEAERIKRYSNLTSEQLDKMIGDAGTRLAELEDALNPEGGMLEMSALPKWMQIEIDKSGKGISEYLTDQIANTDQLISDLAEARRTAVSEAEKNEEELRKSEGELRRKEEERKKKNAEAILEKHKPLAPDTGTDGTVNQAEMLDNALTDLEHRYKIHKVSEADYWAERKRLLELYRDDNSEEWNELYDKVTEHYEKLSETEAKAAEKAAKDSESALKKSIEDKFRELETEQLQKDYDDSWLLEQERAFIETLDHNSEAYRDYNLKLLKEQEKANDALLKAQETAADKQKDALEKSYESLVKSRDSLADSLNISKDIFSSEEETDKRTGEKKKSRGIDTQDYEKKLAAKKKLTSKIAELLEKDVPDSLISELLKQDPEDALFYANQLLKDPKKLSKIKSVFKEDEDVSSILANMVTEKSDEFEKLGTDAGNLFGESFMEAFQSNWESAMQSVFGDEYLSSAALSVSAANSQAGKESISPVSYDGGSENESSRTGAKKAAAIGTNPVYKVLDLNGGYIAKVVREENRRLAAAGGG